MGKHILTQRKGRGTQQFRSRKTAKVSSTRYPITDLSKTVEYTVKNIIHESGRLAPLMVLHGQGHTYYLPAVKGLEEGRKIFIGPEAPIKDGNVISIGNLPEGTLVYNIEKVLNDGGKFVKSAGGYAIIMGHESGWTSIKMPSGKKALFPSTVRATVGIVAGGGVNEKPILKATLHKMTMRARGRKYPIVRGIAMSAVYHPHGGGRHQHPGKPTTISRSTPPGRKVGNIAARKTGRGK
ncbi:MAG: 50S ribosomal protein L2 [Conexivisphaerales archaeon]